ncbi:MAG: 2-oxo acid dehydrogenase subunit E2 [Anaerolineaceae bacterium]|nr:2-oxo acid dehydrogenase subunit E2 [Anaerolineaceae bacterium]
MAETISMPKLGFDMAEGTLVRWVRHEGETVEKGQVLAEIETDKATVEVESSFSGVVLKHLVEQGSIVPVGTAIAVVGEAGEKVDAVPAAAEPAAKAEAAPASDAQAKASATEAPAQPAAVMEGGRVKASPLARKLAEEREIDLSAVSGSGPGGRVVRKDVESYVPAVAPVAAAPAAPVAASAPAAPAAKGPAPVALPPAVWGGAKAPADERVPLDKLRTAIGRRMVESKQQVPHFYVTHNYNVEPMLELRKKLNELLPDDAKLTVNDFIIKAVALALRRFPNINASLAGSEIVRHGQVNVGVAVAVEGGLLTIVTRDTDLKPLRVISAEVREMVARARVGRVKPDDIEGSTFSISNLGMFDVEHFVAIINPPEAAILAVGSAMKVPVVVGDEIKVQTRMKATLSADHRVTDGAEAAQFMQALAEYLEEPLRLVL